MCTNTSPRQLLSAVFALDNAYTKRIYVGLEYDNIIDLSSYKPVVRLSSSRDLRGVDFPPYFWQEFEQALPKFSEFFSNNNIASAIERIEGTEWTAVLRRRRREITVRKINNNNKKKKAYSDFTITMSNFKCLLNILGCINDRLRYLKTIKKFVGDTALGYYEAIMNECQLCHDGQITQYERCLLDGVNEKIKDTIVHDIVKKIGVEKIEKNVPFSATDVEILLLELKGFHMNEIMKNLNSELYLNYL